MSIIVFLLIVLPVSGVCGAASLTIVEERLSVAAENIPLQNLFKQAALAGIKIRIDPQINPLILQDNAELNEVLARLKQEGIAGTAEPDYAYRSGGTPRVAGLSESADTQAQSGAQFTPSSCAVAVLDTGLMETYASQGYIQGSFDALDPEGSISDNLGHGTRWR